MLNLGGNNNKFYYQCKNEVKVIAAAKFFVNLLIKIIYLKIFKLNHQ
jgi:hypothetical protein